MKEVKCILEHDEHEKEKYSCDENGNLTQITEGEMMSLWRKWSVDEFSESYHSDEYNYYYFPKMVS